MKVLPNGIAVIEGDDFISKWVQMEGRLDHDQNALPHILKHILPGHCVVDAGANIGSHTIAYLNAVGPEGRVIAFEPSTASFECLKHNCPGAELYNVALGQADGNLGEMVHNPVNPGASYVTLDGEGVTRVRTLDSIPFQRLDFIKIDVEGYELHVLNGATKTIEQHRPILYVELNEVTLARNLVQVHDIVHAILEHGYRMEFYDSSHSLKDAQVDAFFFPKEKLP